MKKFLPYLLLAGVLVLVFRNWIFASEIIGGDWPYFYQEYIKTFSFLPPAWSSVHGNGMGGPHAVYTIDSYLYLTGWLFSNVLHIPWTIVYKIFWFLLVIILALFSIHSLLKQIGFKISPLIAIPGLLLYLINTYILMVLAGGQLGVALGYAVAPLVLSYFMRLIDTEEVKSKKTKVYGSVLAGLVLALQVLFDFRISYITLLAVGVYFLLHLRTSFKSILYIFVIPFTVTLLLHAFWLIPFAFIGQTSVSNLGAAYTSTESLKFFSFALFENAFGLLHPNWPENIFGKVGFMKPEFLLLPLLAFSSLLFINNKFSSIQKRNLVFFTLLALLGVFLAKGANDPFGSVYIWLFETVPGFVMFRDPTKWYTLIAISYSVLIPIALLYFYEWFKSKVKNQKYLPLTLYFLVILYLLILIKPAVMGELGGTFAQHSVPGEYVSFKNMLLQDQEFSRTLWLPKFQRFGFTTQEHPAVEAVSVLNATNSADMLKEINKAGTKEKLADLSIKYIIIPHDSEHELFLKDRKYNQAERNTIEKTLDKISWLKKDNRFKNLDVYTLENYKDHMYLKNSGELSIKKKSSTEYTINVQTPEKNVLVFTESYSPYWKFNIDGKEIQSKQFTELNSFEIPKMRGQLHMVYSLAWLYELGRVISLITFVSLIILLYKLRRTS